MQVFPRIANGPVAGTEALRAGVRGMVEGALPCVWLLKAYRWSGKGRQRRSWRGAVEGARSRGLRPCPARPHTPPKQALSICEESCPT